MSRKSNTIHLNEVGWNLTLYADQPISQNALNLRFEVSVLLTHSASPSILCAGSLLMIPALQFLMTKLALLGLGCRAKVSGVLPKLYPVKASSPKRKFGGQPAPLVWNLPAKNHPFVGRGAKENLAYALKWTLVNGLRKKLKAWEHWIAHEALLNSVKPLATQLRLTIAVFLAYSHVSL
jgi:hypothetical protein